MYSLSDIWSRTGLRLNVFLQTQGCAMVWIQQLGNVFCIFVYVKAPRSSLISKLADSEKEWLSRNFLTEFPLASLLVCLRFKSSSE